LDQNNIEVEDVLVLNFLLLLALVLFASTDCSELGLLSLLFAAKIKEFAVCQFSCNLFSVSLS